MKIYSKKKKLQNKQTKIGQYEYDYDYEPIFQILSILVNLYPFHQKPANVQKVVVTLLKAVKKLFRNNNSFNEKYG